MSTFAPADPDSTGSESTAPSTESQDQSSEDASSDASTTEQPESSHDPNITWGDDDPEKPEGWVAP